jgi:hypothetical protein
MDHVQDNSSMGGNENYSHELGQQMNNYIVDPSLIDQNQWAQPTAQYTEDIFNSQQGYQHHQHPHHPQHPQHPQQQYLQPAQSPYNYGSAQSPVYPNAQYQNLYGQQPLHSNSIGQYGVEYGGYPSNSQSPMQSIPHQSHQQYATSQSPYSYPPQGQVPATISPHDLERAAPYPAPIPVTNTLTPQPVPSNNGNEFFRRTWTSEPGFQEQPIAVSAPATQYGASDSDTIHVAPRPTVSHYAAVPSAPAVAAVPFVPASQPEPENQSLPAILPAPNVSDAAQKYAFAQLRITDPDLLAETENIPARRFPNAPYAVIGTGTIDLDAKYSCKLN